MGKLDERAFGAIVAGCKSCHGKVFEIGTFLDRAMPVMLGTPQSEGRWIHDGHKFIDGVYRIQCVRCRAEAFTSKDCPRCHRAHALAHATRSASRLAVPQRCPSCKGHDFVVTALAAAVSRIGEGRPAAPTPVAHFGGPAFHVVQITCETCEWVAVAEGCPLCGGPGPLRARPG